MRRNSRIQEACRSMVKVGLGAPSVRQRHSNPRSAESLLGGCMLPATCAFVVSLTSWEVPDSVCASRSGFTVQSDPARAHEPGVCKSSTDVP